MRQPARCSLVLFALLAVGLLATSARAHRFHVSIAEAEFNDSSQCLEVALNVSSQDMEEALRQYDEWAQPAKNEADQVQRLSTYVAQHWSFVSAEGQARQPRWLGSQIEGDHLWLYFEIVLPGGLDGARIDNQIFFELDPRQVNTVNFHEGDWRFSTAYSRNHHVRAIARNDGQ